MPCMSHRTQLQNVDFWQHHHKCCKFCYDFLSHCLHHPPHFWLHFLHIPCWYHLKNHLLDEENNKVKLRMTNAETYCCLSGWQIKLVLILELIPRQVTSAIRSHSRVKIHRVSTRNKSSFIVLQLPFRLKCDGRSVIVEGNSIQTRLYPKASWIFCVTQASLDVIKMWMHPQLFGQDYLAFVISHKNWLIIIVVYFDQLLGAVHAKRRSKSNFLHLFSRFWCKN